MAAQPFNLQRMALNQSRLNHANKPIASIFNSTKILGLGHCQCNLRPTIKCYASSTGNSMTTASGGEPPSNNDGRGGGGDGDGDDGPNPAGGAAIFLSKAAAESLPADLAEAFTAGKLPQEILQRFLDMDKNPLLAWMMKIVPFRERLLADPGFMIKVAIEVGIGICTKTTAEYAKRGEEFSNQLDFVFANLVMAVIADFMLVWLPAPTYSLRAAPKSTNPLVAIFAGCPDNAFQKVQPGMAPFTAAQRFGAVARNGLKLLGVGFFASLLGVGITNGLVGVRQFLDPSFVPLNPPQDVFLMSACYGTYMASSSNLRYQILAGVIEERGIEVFFKNSPGVCAALSFVVRTANTFLGSLLWVDYIRFLGVQK